MPTPTDKKPPYRVSVELVDPATEVIFSYDDKIKAIKDVERMIADGYVTQDRRDDPTNHIYTIYPLSRVKAFRLYEP